MTIIKLDVDYLKQTLDFDETFHRRLMSLMRIFSIQKASIDIYSTAHGRHIYIHFKESLNDVDILLCQLILGSDKDRELFNYERIRSNFLKWNVLFSVKYVGGVIVSREELLSQYMVKLT